MPQLRIGCSGFSYDHWRGPFYPEGLPQRQWFSHYCSVFASVELNVTFYRLPQPATFEHWRRDSPEGFRFAVKGSRYITHVLRLADPEEPLERFYTAARHLGEKLGTVLWQFPPDLVADPGRCDRFLALLDRYPNRKAFECRHPSWLESEIIDRCREHNVTLCMADWPPFLADLPPTADFVYLRRHGQGGRYASRYTPEELARDAERIKSFLAQRDVFIYFNNDYAGYAPANARELTALLAGRERWQGG